MNAAEHIEPVEGYLETAGGKLHYLDWGGSGRQAHFLHGNGFCAGTYSPLIRLLQDDFHFIASDVRGHGGSDQLNIKRVRHWRIFADDLRMLVKRTMSPPVIGMGHSLGAVTTYIAAAEYPQLFTCIILFDPPILPRRILWTIGAMRLVGLAGNIPLARGARKRRKVFQGKKEALKRFTSGRGIFKTWSKEFVESYLECGLLEKDSETAILKCDPELEAQIFESTPLDVWRYAPKISCPVLAIRGEYSDAFSADSAKRLNCIADYELKTIAGCGHFVPMEKPEECARIIKEFVARKCKPFNRPK
jgi:pimeloyl-ACP methyl ester carboxylesterase